MPNPDEQRRGPAFFVEHYPGDYGARPLPSSAARFECPGIRVDGLTRIQRGPLAPGSTIALSVMVGNSGNANGRVTISASWARLALGIGGAQLTRGAIASFTEPRNVGEPPALTAVRTWTTPADLKDNDHMCIVVQVGSAEDPAPAASSIADRHFAQLNLKFLTVDPRVPTPFSFQMGNPSAHARTFRVRAWPLPPDAFTKLNASTGKLPVAMPLSGLRIGLQGRVEGESFTTRIGPGDAIDCTAQLAALSLADGEVGAFSLEQSDEVTGEVVGSLTVVLTAVRGTPP